MRVLFLLLVVCSLVACGDDDTSGTADTNVASDSGGTDTNTAADTNVGADTNTADTGECVPTCDGSTCGDDGCGGECACGEGDICTAELTCAPPTATSCPPAGPFGTAVGDTAADATAYDCDGNPVTLHSLCDQDVSWILTFAEWCPNCRTFARSGQLNALADDFADDDVSGYVLVTETSSFGTPADAEACARVRDSFGLRVNVLFDPDGDGIRNSLGLRPNSTAVVFEQGSGIVWKGGDSGINGEISRRLSE